MVYRGGGRGQGGGERAREDGARANEPVRTMERPISGYERAPSRPDSQKRRRVMAHRLAGKSKSQLACRKVV